MAQQPSPEYNPNDVPAPTSPPLALVGQSSYQQNCAPCHGAQGMGDGPTAAQLPGPPTAFADSEAIWALSPAQLFHTTKFGRIEKLMPPWSNRLNDEQIWQTVAYAWSLHTTQKDVEAGAELYNQSCANCHGARGAGDGPDAPADLTDFSALDAAIFSSQADWQAGWQAAHPELGADWSEAQQHNVLEYMRTFSYTPPWEAAYHAGAGAITGKVTQGTPGGMDPAGLTATLEAYVNFSLVSSFTTTVDAEGGFAFSELDTTPGIAYLVSATVDQIRYSSPVLNFSADQQALETTVAIYGTTEDGSGLRVNRLHWIIDSQPGTVIVGEIFSFGNQSDRTFIGKQIEGVDAPVTIGLQLPTGAKEITFENGALGGRFQQAGDLIYDTTPVVPGEETRQIIVRYLLPHDGTSLDFNQDFLYPVDQVTILVAELPNLQVNIPGFALASNESLQGQSYQLWQPEATNSTPNQVAVKLGGLLQLGDIDPRTVQQSSSGDAPAAAVGATTVPLLESWAAWLVGAVMSVALLGVLLWSYQQQGKQDDTSRSPLQDLQVQKQRLIQQIAELDDRHANQTLNDAQWQQARAQAKAQLLTVATRLVEAEQSAGAH
ncbi:MAG: c-type cytochrome [Caldilineaceae bacterium]